MVEDNTDLFLRISIHAPHAGSDRCTLIAAVDGIISIHAPHAGSDAEAQSEIESPKFQSTLPMRGATATYCGHHHSTSRCSTFFTTAGSQGTKARHNQPSARCEPRLSNTGRPMLAPAHNARNPSGSYERLAPTCSIFLA